MNRRWPSRIVAWYFQPGPHRYAAPAAEDAPEPDASAPGPFSPSEAFSPSPLPRLFPLITFGVVVTFLRRRRVRGTHFLPVVSQGIRTSRDTRDRNSCSFVAPSGGTGHEAVELLRPVLCDEQ